MKGFFITATDTAVGKTFVSGVLIKALNFLGLKTGAMKPIESGCGREGDVLIPYDGLFLKQISHMEEPVNTVAPVRLENPMAPLPASEIEGVDIDVAEIIRSYEKLSSRYDAMVVEGIGGLMVPVTTEYFLLDLARIFGLPMLVVARPGLGTLNHTMLTVNYALKEGLEVAGVIINHTNPPDNSPAERTNVKILSRISPVPIVGVIPYVSNPDEETFEHIAARELRLEAIKKYI